MKIQLNWCEIISLPGFHYRNEQRAQYADVPYCILGFYQYILFGLFYKLSELFNEMLPVILSCILKHIVRLEFAAA